jgi:FkbM family methyltransferase
VTLPGKRAIKRLLPGGLRRAYSRAGVALRARVRARADQVRVCPVRGLEIRLAVSSETERFRALTYASKEPETLAWLDASLAPGDVFYDLGANVGLYSLYAAKRCPGCRVYAFEPEAQNFARLCRNVSLNQLANVVPCSLAISGDAGMEMFEVHSHDVGSALHGLAGTVATDGHSSGPLLRQMVMSHRLDDLVAGGRVPAPNWIKIDVDGVEDRIIAGATAVLSDPGLRGVLIELNCEPGQASSPVAERLQQFGFVLAAQSEWSYRWGSVESRNFIFAR